MKRTDLRPAILGAIAALALAGGVAIASIPDADGVIHACYSQANGTFRPIDYPSHKCRNGESLLDFNQTGPKGDPGTNGINGIDGRNGTNGINGVDGKDGQDGVSGYEIVRSSATMFANGVSEFFAICPEGKKVVSAGWEVLGQASFSVYGVHGGIPETLSGGPFDGRSVWRFRYENPTSINITVSVAGVCVTAN